MSRYCCKFLLFFLCSLGCLSMFCFSGVSFWVSLSASASSFVSEFMFYVPHEP